MNETAWYYRIFSEEFGPVTASEIAQLCADGTLGPDDLVRADGSTEWGTAEQMSQTVTDHASSEITDMSELNFVFEENEPTRDADSSEIVSHGLQSDSEYYVETLGQIFGPMPVSCLVKMAESGALISDEKIRCGEDGEWCSPDVIPDIAVAIGTAASRTAATTDQRQSSPPLRRSATKPTARAVSALSATTTEGSAATSPQASGIAAHTANMPTTGTTPCETTPTRKKRRRKAKPDEFLQEIFSELFTEDGKVRDVSDRPKKSAVAVPAQTSEAAGASSDRTTANERLTVAPVAGGASMPAVATRSTSGGMPTSPQKSTPPGAPPVCPTRPPKKTGGGFSMPEPKVLGIIGGVAIVFVLLTAVFTGMILLPGRSMDVAAKLQPLGVEYVGLLSGAITEEKWKDYGSRVRVETRTVVEYLKSKGTPTEQEKNFQEAAVKYVELVNSKADDVDGQKAIFEEINTLLR